MNTKSWQQCANFFLLIHVLFTIFMLITPIIIYIGMLQSWHWINNPGFRHTHIFFLVFVIFEVCLASPCPLAVWEDQCREKAGMTMRYSAGFFDFWSERLLGLTLNAWAFNLIFGSLAVITFIEYYFFWIN